jgi:hypothetical protein
MAMAGPCPRPATFRPKLKLGSEVLIHRHAEPLRFGKIVGHDAGQPEGKTIVFLLGQSA